MSLGILIPILQWDKYHAKVSLSSLPIMLQNHLQI